MTNYKAWYDPQENKYYLKIDGEEKQEITKTRFYLLLSLEDYKNDIEQKIDNLIKVEVLENDKIN